MMTYPELLIELKNQEADNHLLLGNGFNNSLCISTSYKDIYNRMIEEYTPYEKIKDIMCIEGYDIEKLINRYKNQTVGCDKKFLDEFIEKKIKKDFMESLSDIATSKVKDLYHDEKRNIYLFFNNFTNYFTLNYDPFLYLIFMKFIKNKENQGLVSIQGKHFFASDSIKRLDAIYKFIEKAYTKGKLEMDIEGEIKPGTPINLNKISKTFFTEAVKKSCSDIIKKENWSGREIEIAVNKIYNNNDHESKPLIINDGFIKNGNSAVYDISQQESLFLDEKRQNLFFLHGGFHLIEKNGRIHKIIQSQESAFHKRLRQIIHSDEEDVICVLTGTSEDKENQIKNNTYLRRGFQKLDAISGNIVILGCSFSENDNHIFNKLKNNENIKTIFVATCDDEKTKIKKAIEKVLFGKKIVYFNYETINGFAINE